MKKSNSRIYFLFSILFLFFFFITSKLFYIQIIKHKDFEEKANSQQIKMIEINSPRGTIYDRNGKELAVSLNVKSLYAIPSKITYSEKKLITKYLSSMLDLDKNYLYEKVNKKSNFIWIERKMTPFDADKITRCNLPGLGFINETKRFYPDDKLACHIIGFAGLDNRGLEGIELACDKLLIGVNGWMTINTDAFGRSLISNIQQYSKPKVGAVLTLTIDKVIQHIAESELERVVKEFKAKSGSVIVMEPKTGEILALANIPFFNLNNYSSSSLDERRNRIVADAYEPGSTFKIVALAAAFESDIFKEDDKIYCENGEYEIFNHKVHDHEPRGMLTLKQVIGYSNNIGTIKVALKIGHELIYKYAKNFGFGDLTNIELPGEIKGTIREPKEWSKLSNLAVPIGQEVAVTSIQLISAYASIANGGFLMKPAIIKSIKKDDEVLFEYKPVIIKRTISEKTAKRIIEILKTVVKEGTGVLANLPEYEVAGKTGTAQKTDTNTGNYSQDKYVASFVGFVPAYNPKFVILVCIDEPSYVYWGGSIAGPCFREIAKKTLRYLETGINRNRIKENNKYDVTRAN